MDEKELLGRVVSLETMLLVMTGILVKHAYADDPDGSKFAALLNVVEKTALERGRGLGIEKQTAAAISDLNRILMANRRLLWSTSTSPNA